MKKTKLLHKSLGRTTSRRQVLLGGLAAIIAAGKAPASIIRSNLGGAQQSLEADGGNFEIPYVTDGLIAMWDGKWNAGLGVHDPSLGKCVNLKSPGVFDTPYTYVTIGNDYTEVLSDNPYINLPKEQGSLQQIIATAWTSYGDGVTIEALINNSGGGSISRWICGTGGGGAGSIGFGGASLNGVGLKNYRSGYDFSPQHWNLQSVTISRDGYKFYINGNLVDTQSTPTFNPNPLYTNYMSFARGTAFQFRCWRYYTRMLTASEIANNYSIDQARFGI